MSVPALAIFDLDHTLLSGDSDALWCEFLMDAGLLDRAEFEPRNRAMAERYAAGVATPAEFCGFYVGTLAGRSPAAWQRWRERFLAAVITPRIPDGARDLVARHREHGDRLLLSTATNRFLTELTAAELGFADVIATETELVEGIFSGRTVGTPNMRDGKVERLRAWIGTMGLDESTLGRATFYSDSANDLPLLRTVGHPVAVDPDPVLARQAASAGWPVLRLQR